MEDNTEELNLLRELVNLNALDALKVKRARIEAEHFRDLYIKQNPGDITGVDYTTANDLELLLRRNKLENNLEKQWQKYGDGLSLKEYTEEYIKEQLDNKYSHKM